MLINTVILFIRDLLPCFMLLSLLLVICPSHEKHVYRGALIGLGISALMFFSVAALSQLLDGAGLELIQACLLVAFMSSVVLLVSWLFYKTKTKFSPVLWVMALLIVPNMLNFAIYLTAYWPSQGQNMSLLLGVLFGLGISSSLACLIYLLLKLTNKLWLSCACLIVFSAGQVAEAANLFEQIDWLPGTASLWNTSGFVSDESEYGHLLRVLVGYEATPSLLYVVFYSLGILIPVGVMFILSRRHPS